MLDYRELRRPAPHDVCPPALLILRPANNVRPRGCSGLCLDETAFRQISPRSQLPSEWRGAAASVQGRVYTSLQFLLRSSKSRAADPRLASFSSAMLVSDESAMRSLEESQNTVTFQE